MEWALSILGFDDTADSTGAATYDADNTIDVYYEATIASATYTTGSSLATAMTAAILATSPGNTYTVTWNNATKLFEIQAAASGAVTYRVMPATGPNSATSIGSSIGWTSDETVSAYPWRIDSNTMHMNSVVAGVPYSVGFPLLAGKEGTVVLERSLYARLDPDATFRVPLSVRRSRIISRVGGHR